jgi:colicin import membrane protein
VTTRTTPQTSDEKLALSIYVSIAFHLAVVAMMTVRAVLYPSVPLRLENSIRVDIVDLPDRATAKLPPIEEPAPQAPPQTKPELPQPQPPVQKPTVITKPAPPKPDVPKFNPNKSKRDQDAALKRLEALERLQSKPQPETAAPTHASAAQPRPQPIKGNEISTGSSLKGIARLEQQSYIQKIDQMIKRHWVLPQWMANASLSARVRLYIDSQGRIVKREFTRSSKNPLFDERVTRAIDSAGTLPVPPNNLVNALQVDGIELEFVPE